MSGTNAVGVIETFVIMTGDVSAVRHAVESGARQHETDGMVAKTIVIPSPHSDLKKALY